jgi:hypothetical protein
MLGWLAYLKMALLTALFMDSVSGVVGHSSMLSESVMVTKYLFIISAQEKLSDITPPFSTRINFSKGVYLDEKNGLNVLKKDFVVLILFGLRLLK